MEFRVLDEAVIFEGRGVALLVDGDDEAAADVFSDGCRIRDVRGTVHVVDRVTRQDGFICLLLKGGNPDYFGRLFRDVLVEATRFALLEGEA